MRNICFVPMQWRRLPDFLRSSVLFRFRLNYCFLGYLIQKLHTTPSPPHTHTHTFINQWLTNGKQSAFVFFGERHPRRITQWVSLHTVQYFYVLVSRCILHTPTHMQCMFTGLGVGNSFIIGHFCFCLNIRDKSKLLNHFVFQPGQSTQRIRIYQG